MKSSRPIKAIGRKRRAAGWTLLTLGLLVAGVWVASRWYFTHWSGRTIGLSLFAGRISVSTGVYVGSPKGWAFEAASDELARWDMWHGWHSTETSPAPTVYFMRGRGVIFIQEYAGAVPGRHASLAFWPIPPLLWASAALLLRSGVLARKRANTNACPKCGYSLAGLAPNAPCPECGKAAKTTA